MRKYLTKELFRQLEKKRSNTGFSLEDAIRSGIVNADSDIGIYAGDPHCYKIFAPLLDPIIQEYHDLKPEPKHLPQLTPVDLPESDSAKRYIRSTRVRVARNLKGFRFAAHLGLKERLTLEKTIVDALLTLGGEFQGEYYSLGQLDSQQQTFLQAGNLLFPKGDRFQQAAGINTDFPAGRGIFVTNDGRLRVWINEEDHLRIISQSASADLSGVFNHLAKALEFLEQKLFFVRDETYGYLTSCPTNIGTSMRAGVHIHLEKLNHNRALLDSIIRDHKLQMRGTQGEKTSIESSIFDISNRRRYGISEVDIIQSLHQGLAALIAAEDNN